VTTGGVVVAILVVDDCVVVGEAVGVVDVLILSVGPEVVEEDKVLLVGVGVSVSVVLAVVLVGTVDGETEITVGVGVSGGVLLVVVGATEVVAGEAVVEATVVGTAVVCIVVLVGEGVPVGNIVVGIGVVVVVRYTYDIVSAKVGIVQHGVLTLYIIGVTVLAGLNLWQHPLGTSGDESTKVSLQPPNPTYATLESAEAEKEVMILVPPMYSSVGVVTVMPPFESPSWPTLLAPQTNRRLLFVLAYAAESPNFKAVTFSSEYRTPEKLDIKEAAVVFHVVAATVLSNIWFALSPKPNIVPSEYKNRMLYFLFC
jgi:hypothetical protein